MIPPSDDHVANAVADAHRREWAFVLAATARVACDIDLAEECVQDAYVAALDAWTTRRCAGQSRRVADHGRPAQSARRAAPGPDAAAKLPLLVEPVEPTVARTKR